MIKHIKINDLMKLDRPTWLLIALIVAAFLQIALTKLTGILEFRTGYMSAFLASGTLAYLMIWRAIGNTALARVCLYMIAALLTYRLIPQFREVIFGEPNHFDVYAFYLNSKVAAAGINMYSPESYAQIADQMAVQVNDRFRREIIEVGFMYPPPSALLFLPLSLGEFEHAARAWYMFVGATILGTCVLLAVLVLRESGVEFGRNSIIDALSLSTIIVMSNSIAGLRYGQTTALLSCIFIVTLLYVNRSAGGVAAVFGILIKPFAVIPAFFLLIGRYWSGVIAGLLTGLVIISVSLVVLGTDNWASYLALEFSTQAPAWLYNEPGNKSLLAVLIRAFGINDVPWEYAKLVLVYGNLVLFFVVTSFWAAIKIARRNSFTAYSLLLVCVLIIYPGTLYSYSIILAVPLVVELVNQLKSKEHYVVTVVTFAIVGALWQWSLFAANVFVWILLFRRAWINSRSTNKFGNQHIGEFKRLAAHVSPKS